MECARTTAYNSSKTAKVNTMENKDKERRPPDKPLTYAKVISKTTKTNLLDLNIVLIKIKRDFEKRDVPFNDELCKKALKIAKINHLTDTNGCQYHFDKGIITIEIWLKNHVTIVSNEEKAELAEGFNLLSIHPKNKREVPVVVIGLSYDVPDQAVTEYLQLFGLKAAANKIERLKAKNGMWKDQNNGDRRYTVDMSTQLMNMGTFHVIMGEKVRIIYPGNTKTCGNCHEAASSCPGNGIANKCRQNNGKTVRLDDHMRYLHDELRAIREHDQEANQRPQHQHQAPGQLPATTSVLTAATAESQQQQEDFPPQLEEQLLLAATQSENSLVASTGSNGSTQTQEGSTQSTQSTPPEPSLNKDHHHLPPDPEEEEEFKEELEEQKDVGEKDPLVEGDKPREASSKKPQRLPGLPTESKGQKKKRLRRERMIKATLEGEDSLKSSDEISAAERSMDNLYKSIVIENNSDLKDNQKGTFFEDNHSAVLATYPSIFDQHSNPTTPSRQALIGPSSSTPFLFPSGATTPKRMRETFGESPEAVKVSRQTSPILHNDSFEIST